MLIFILIHLYLQNHLRLSLETGIPSWNPTEALTKNLKVMLSPLVLSGELIRCNHSIIERDIAWRVPICRLAAVSPAERTSASKDSDSYKTGQMSQSVTA